jgi:hypothetical protein
MSDETTTQESSDASSSQPAASGVSEAPAASTQDSKQPQSLPELIANVDITGLTDHAVITDLVAGMQQLALRGTIALGLLERIAKRDSEAEDAQTNS